MENAVLLNEVHHAIKPFKHIHIGDPRYFEMMSSGSKNSCLKEMTCDFKTSCCNVGAIIIRESELKYDFGKFTQIEVKVLLAENDAQLEVYKSGRWYGEQSVKHNYDLACDTARYDIEVDGRYDRVHTGADGYYGEMRQMKQHYGLMLSLTFDGSLFSMERVEKLMNYLFVFVD